MHMNTENLDQELKGFVLSIGAGKVGFADLGHTGEIRKAYGNTWDNYPVAISVALNMPSAVIRKFLPRVRQTAMPVFTMLLTSHWIR